MEDYPAVGPCLAALLFLPFLACCSDHSGPLPDDMSNQTNQMFSEAEAYERFMGRWSRQLAPLFVEFADPPGSSTILDAGSGTGALAMVLQSLLPTSRVTGIDPSRVYVDYARANNSDPMITFEVGDARRLGFENDSFDATLSLLVVNFIPDAPRAVQEFRRVTRPGGVVAACVWDYADGMEMLRFFWDEAVALDPSAESKDERHMPYCEDGGLATLWKTAGLESVQEKALTISMQYTSFEDYWLPFLEGQGPAGSHVLSLTEGQQVELRDRLRGRILGDRPNTSFTLKARAWTVRGIVPAN